MKTFILDTSLLILLLSLLNRASSIRFTPNTLTETSNLLNQTNEPVRSELFCKFRVIIDKFDETYIESQLGVQQNEFVRLGVNGRRTSSAIDRHVTEFVNNGP